MGLRGELKFFSREKHNHVNGKRKELQERFEGKKYRKKKLQNTEKKYPKKKK